MTEKEQQLIENLTKQIEISNKLSLKQMQESNTPSLNEERINEAEIGLISAKEEFFKQSSTLLSTINIFFGVLAAFICMGILLLIISLISSL